MRNELPERYLDFVRSGIEPAMRCESGVTPPVAVCSVACLEWNLRIGNQTFFATAIAEKVSSLEIFSAKEARSRLDCSGKHLGCLLRANKGLQYGLSGSRVAGMATS